MRTNCSGSVLAQGNSTCFIYARVDGRPVSCKSFGKVQAVRDRRNQDASDCDMKESSPTS
jgi:hypothetical protein